MLRLAIQRLGLVVSSQLGQNDAERCQGPGQLGQEDVEVSLSQTADDGQPGLIVLGGAGRVPRRHRDVAQPLAADAQVPLPPAVGRVGGSGQPLADRQPGPVVLGGAGRVPRRHRDVAQPLAADAQVPLPLGVGRVGGDQPLADRQPGPCRPSGPVVLGGAGQVPRCHREVAQPLAADAQVPLPLGVGRVGGGQPLREGQPGPGPVVLGGAGQVPRRHREVAQPLAANAQVPLPPGRLNHYKRKEYIQPRQGCNLFRFFKASALPTLTASQYHHSACRRSQSSKSCPNYS